MNKIPFSSFFFIFLSIIGFNSCRNPNIQYREILNLQGTWQFAMDSAKAGEDQKWLNSVFTDSIYLPGTMDENHKGYRNNSVSTLFLNRLYQYQGRAWYRKEIIIPESWKDKHIELIMERTKPSKIWVDGQYAGNSVILQSPQHYDLSPYLNPGKHIIMVCIDNTLSLTPYGNVHIYTDHTQTNWNGIIGNILLEASDRIHIADIQLYPDIKNNRIGVDLYLANSDTEETALVELHVTKEINGKIRALKTLKHKLKCDSVLHIEYPVGDKVGLWDEYHQPIYRMNAVIKVKDKAADNKAAITGMRKFEARGTQFAINGRITFLRGKHDGCVFPLTGHPPMDTAGWMKVFRIAKSYGINHYRFHSWCPPEAAFEAADRMGIFIQAELPFWGGLNSDTIARMLAAEGEAMLSNYANHPSFVMFSPGNEIWGGHDRVEKVMTTLKEKDSRPLYTQGTNNNIGYKAPAGYEDFHVAARTPYDHDTTLTHTRLTQAFADSKEGGMLNTIRPSASLNFDYAVSQIKMPLIGHETGQYQIYPDYSEINKYTGILKASNLEEFKNRLENAGMLDLNKDFNRASGALAALCYRAEIEAALRTKGMAGFQLLDLQDYPGQGTALVGILDAFMNSKEVISRDEWRQFCNDVVPLLNFRKFIWTNKEVFTADMVIANYSAETLNTPIRWTISDPNSRVIKEGIIKDSDIAAGGLSHIAKIEYVLHEISSASRLTISIALEKTSYKNQYSIWVYPDNKEIFAEKEIYEASELSAEVLKKLEEGANVLLIPVTGKVKNNSVKGLFPPDFWNYGMFKAISENNNAEVSPGTLGILTDPMHPLFKLFPTDFYSNWQWWNIIKNSNPLILDLTQKDFRPIVQIVDNLERNHKLGLIFECRAGNGKLLVCMTRLHDIMDEPEARQLYISIHNYMTSGDFNPSFTFDTRLLHQIIR